MNKTYIQGFDGYTVLFPSYNVFTPYHYPRPPLGNYNPDGYIINRGLPVKIEEGAYCEITFSPIPCKDNKELLLTAKKVFVHSSCKISRTMLSSKYKKALNPWLSDVVVVPKLDTTSYELFPALVFANDSAKLVAVFRLYDTDGMECIKSFKTGDKLKDLIRSPFYPNSSYGSYSMDDLMDSEFICSESVLKVPNNQTYVLDILTNKIPADKIVYEESVQESLSDESNQLSLDTILSIKDMIDSSDSNTVSAGLKALSMMDWMHYPNSIRYILWNTDRSKWIYNSACNSTSVKYMFNTLAGKNRRRWPGSEDCDIYEEDLNLYKQLKMHCENLTPDKLLIKMGMCNFTYVCGDGSILPRIKERAV